MSQPDKAPNPLQELPPSSEVRARLGQCLQETQLLRSLLRLSEKAERSRDVLESQPQERAR